MAAICGAESFSGTCARSFYVGDAVKKEDIHAKFEDGILHIQLPAPQQQKALPENPNLIEDRVKRRSCASKSHAHKMPRRAATSSPGAFYSQSKPQAMLVH